MHTTHPIRDQLGVPGATLHYEVRGHGPLLVLHAAPMDARAFDELADLIAADHTVLTVDPRGIARSTVEDPSAPATPDQRAEDLARVLVHIDAGPAVVLGSSGGAVSALALAQTHPDLLEGVIAHEPPLIDLLEDREALRAGIEAMIATYRTGDRIAYWRQFMDLADIAMPEDFFQMVFGRTPMGRDAEDERYGVEQMQAETSFWTPDLDVLRSCGVPIVIGIGEDSTGQLCDQTSRALADALDIVPHTFPGDHTGFVDAPDAFAAALRDVVGALR